MSHPARRSRHSSKTMTGTRALFETLESRSMFSASVAVLVIQLPEGIPAVQTDLNADAGEGVATDASLSSALDIHVRHVRGGIYLTVAASSTQVMALAPGGVVDIYDGETFLATVSLGGVMRSAVVLPAGQHSFHATYTGDANFLPSETTEMVFLNAPTNTAPKRMLAPELPTNDSGERIRGSRLLSRIDYFDAAGLSVGALPPIGGFGSGEGTLAPAIKVPTPRFSKITFSVAKLPRFLPVSRSVIFQNLR